MSDVAKLVDTVDTLNARIVKLESDRADLLAALKLFVEDTECGDGFQLATSDDHECHEFRRWRAALAAIAKAESHVG